MEKEEAEEEAAMREEEEAAGGSAWRVSVRCGGCASVDVTSEA